MEFYLTLSLGTLAVALLAALLWLRTRSPLVLAGLGLVYYWSLYGAWFILAEQHGAQSPMHYHTIFEQLAPVYLDADYLAALRLHLVFVLVLELTLLACLRRAEPGQRPAPRPVTLSQARLFALAAGSGAGAVALLAPAIMGALATEQPLYAHISLVLAAGGLPLYPLHQILLHLSLLPAALGLVIGLCGPGARWLRPAGSRGWLVGQALVLAAMAVFLSLSGNRHELFVTLVTGLLFYLVNHPRPRLSAALGAGAGLALLMGLIDLVRGLGIRELAGGVGGGFWEWARQALTSNEAFAAHLSMYYSLHGGLPLTWGSSIVSLAASLVPRVLWPGRPPDIYQHYAAGLGVQGVTGYTIHHAAGWYLNFGLLGVVLGAAVLGWVWAALLSAPGRRLASRGPRWRALAALVPCTFTAQLASMLRAGPEAYKGVALTAIGVPLVMLLFAVSPGRREAKP